MAQGTDAPKGSEARPLYYSCEHGPSNAPCPVHHPEEFAPKQQEDGSYVLVPKAGAVKSDDWHKSYTPPKDGLTDSASVKPA